MTNTDEMAAPPAEWPGQEDLMMSIYEPEPAPPDAATRLVGVVCQAVRDLGYLSGVFWVSLAGFVVGLTLFVVGASLFWLVVGLFVLVAALVAAGGFAVTQRRLLWWAGHELPAPEYPASTAGVRGRLARLRSAQSWKDLLHILVTFALTLATFPLAVSWTASGFGGVTYWFWSQYLPDDRQGLPALLGYPGPFIDVTVNSLLGCVALLTTPAVLRGLVRLHAAIAGALLVDHRAGLREQVTTLTESRAAAGDAELHTLRRLERDLHDGPQQRLVRLGMDLSAAQRKLRTDPEQADALLSDAFAQSQDALAEIRTLSRGIAPPILTEQGLAAAVTGLAARGMVPTTVDVAPVSISDAGQNAAYFVIAEALTNMEKHARAAACSVEVRQAGALAVITVADDGGGGAAVAKGHGLAGLADRLAGVGGTLTVASPPGGPTAVTATIPIVTRSSSA